MKSELARVKKLEWFVAPALNAGKKLLAYDCFGNEFARLDLPRSAEFIATFMEERQVLYNRTILSALEETSDGK